MANGIGGHKEKHLVKRKKENSQKDFTIPKELNALARSYQMLV
jgi:hypothetical protein